MKYLCLGPFCHTPNVMEFHPTPSCLSLSLSPAERGFVDAGINRVCSPPRLLGSFPLPPTRLSNSRKPFRPCPHFFFALTAQLLELIWDVGPI